MAVHAHVVLGKTRSNTLAVAPFSIGGVGGVNPHVRQRQALKKKFEGRVVAGCLQSEGSQVLKEIESGYKERRRGIGLDPSKVDAEF